MVASGIRFNDCSFSEPTRLTDWTPPRFPGILAILAADANWSPRPFQPLDFVEFGNNADFTTFLRAANRNMLFVAVLPMSYSTTAQRCAVRGELIRAYNPMYRFGPVEYLRGEARLGEQPVEPDRPRRPIGFITPPDPAQAKAY
jgi:hypothetical protein